MNFLNHLIFSPENEDFTIGLLIGNSARKGSYSRYNLDILKGIALDMQINLFSENHPAFQRSKSRVSYKYSKYSTFIVNLFYDHLLAKNWDTYSNVSLGEFSNRIYKTIKDNRTVFPYKIKKFAPAMISENWIAGINSIEGTHQYIKMVSRSERLTKNLDQSLFELMENYQRYNNDFEEYFTALSEFMDAEARRFNTITDEKQLLQMTG